MPPLARRSFWVPPDKIEAFARAYAALALPLLRQRGWQEAGAPQRPAPLGVFSRLFTVAQPEQVPLLEARLRRDPRWQETMAQLGQTAGREVLFRLGIYAAPARADRPVEAGRGQRQGLWHTLSTWDGLPSSLVNKLLQDHQGRLWVATCGAVCAVMTGPPFRSSAPPRGWLRIRSSPS